MHIPVLYNEALNYLNPKSGENFVDCTLGDGGHSLGILERNAPEGKLLVIDRDIEMIKRVLVRISDMDLENRMTVVNDNYANLEKIILDKKFNGINGVLLDLGMSSFHIDESGRGFSFQKNEELDMRYCEELNCENGKRGSLTAKEIVNSYGVGELEEIFREYGGERFSFRVAKKICETRKFRPINTTKDLVGVIKMAIPARYSHGRIHFATRIFQALRIEVNHEIENIKFVLPQAMNILEKNGRLVVISFHSLEDAAVKKFFRENALNENLEILTKKPISPTYEEIKNNPRARSAKLRAAIKL